jgi:chemotaxis protein MotB
MVKRGIWFLWLGLTTVACGYTEEEWKAQLAKYDQLSHQCNAEKQEKARLQQQLEAEKQRAGDLQKQLEKMGINLDSMNAQLQQTDTEKAQLAANLDQLKRALDEYKQRADQLERIKQRFELLRDKLNKLTQLGLKVEVRNNRMVIRLPGDVLFPSGSDKLKDQGVTVLGQVADVIRNDQQLSKRYFQVAGHTDNKPLQGGQFKDNWGLSLMRARQVLIWLIADPKGEGSGGGLDARRLHAAGYGETDPVTPNDDDAKRASNRRVELVLLPDVEEMLDLRQLL